MYTRARGWTIFTYTFKDTEFMIRNISNTIQKRSIMIRTVLLAVLLPFIALSCAKAQSKYRFSLVEFNTLGLKEVLRGDRQQLNEYVSGEDMLISYNTADSLLDITYLSREEFYSFLRSNSTLVQGVCVDNGFMAVLDASNQFFKDGEITAVLSINTAEKKIEPEIINELILFPSPINHVTCIYKYVNGKFVLVSRNAILNK